MAKTPEEAREAVVLHNRAEWGAFNKMTLQQAVLYSCGYSTQSELPESCEVPDDLRNVKNALINEIRAGTITNEITAGTITIVGLEKVEDIGQEKAEDEAKDIRQIDWNNVIVTKDFVDNWLGLLKSSPKPHGLSRMARYSQILDANSEYYSNRLAAALEAVAYIKDNPKLLKKDQPKEAVMKYLAEHRKDITPTARAHIAKVVNWKTAGGRKKK